MIFFPILQVRSLHFDIKARRSVCSARPAVMKGFGFGIKNHSPTGQMKLLAPVHIVRVHEKSLVEQAGLVQGIPPCHPKPAVEHIDVSGSVKLEVLHQITAEEPRALEKRDQEESPQKKVPEGWKPHPRTMHAPSRVEHSRTQEPNSLILFHVRMHFGQAI